jgi:SAM-dependent methyltransferase
MGHSSQPESPSDWVVRWAPLVKRGPVLDVASGPGRHARFFAERGFDVVAVDRDPQSIPDVKFVQADLEDGSPWPFGEQRFGAIVVTNYLHRPLFKAIESSLTEGGVHLRDLHDRQRAFRAPLESRVPPQTGGIAGSVRFAAGGGVRGG